MVDQTSIGHILDHLGLWPAGTARAGADPGAGRKPGRESPRERMLAINLGLALEDMATAIRVYRLARDQRAGLELPL